MLGGEFGTTHGNCLREIGKHLNCVLELYKVCSHFVFLHIFHSVFSFLCFASTMKMPFRTDRCLESTSVYSGVSLSLNTLRSSTNHISLYFLYKYRNSWLTFIKRNACFTISRLYTQIMSNVYKKVISIWNTWFVFIKKKGILIIFETLSAIEEIFLKHLYSVEVMHLSLADLHLSKVSFIAFTYRSFLDASEFFRLSKSSLSASVVCGMCLAKTVSQFGRLWCILNK